MKKLTFLVILIPMQVFAALQTQQMETDEDNGVVPSMIDSSGNRVPLVPDESDPLIPNNSFRVLDSSPATTMDNAPVNTLAKPPIIP